MKKRGFLVGVLIASMMTMMYMPSAFAATAQPQYFAGSNVVIANGTPITITEGTGGSTVISWTEHGGGSFVVDSPTNASLEIYGGYYDNSESTSTSITMTGGTVCYIGGGGYMGPSSTNPVHVTTATISITGGTITGANKIGGVSGGGIGAPNTSLTDAEAGTSSNTVDTANITIGPGVTTIPGANGVYLYSGGASGNCYVGSSTVNVAGGEWTSVIAGGSIGYVGTSTINVSGGDIENIHGNNHGSVGQFNLNISGGTITDVYAGADINDPIVEGTLGSASIDISGGSVTNLSLGYDAAGALPDSTLTSLNYLTTAVGSVPPGITPSGFYLEIDGNQLLAIANQPLSSNSWYSQVTTKAGSTFNGFVNAQGISVSGNWIVDESDTLTTVFTANPVTPRAGIPSTSDNVTALIGLAVFGAAGIASVAGAYALRRRKTTV